LLKNTRAKLEEGAGPGKPTERCEEPRRKLINAGILRGVALWIVMVSRQNRAGGDDLQRHWVEFRLCKTLVMRPVSWGACWSSVGRGTWVMVV